MSITEARDLLMSPSGWYRYPRRVLSAGLLFVVILVAVWIFVVILGVALRFRHLMRRKDR